MPIYEYQCRRCGHRLEAMQRIADRPLKRCPECGGGLKKLISAPAFQFKGSGWYVTDYAGKKSAEAEGEGKTGAKGEGEGKTEAKGEGKTEGKTEAQGETKTEPKGKAESAEGRGMVK